MYSSSNKDYVVLEEGEIPRSMEQKRGPRNRSTQIHPTDFSQRHRSNLTEGRNFSTGDAGAIGHPLDKNTNFNLNLTQGDGNW